MLRVYWNFEIVNSKWNQSTNQGPWVQLAQRHWQDSCRHSNSHMGHGKPTEVKHHCAALPGQLAWPQRRLSFAIRMCQELAQLQFWIKSQGDLENQKEEMVLSWISLKFTWKNKHLYIHHLFHDSKKYLLSTQTFRERCFSFPDKSKKKKKTLLTHLLILQAVPGGVQEPVQPHSSHLLRTPLARLGVL